MRQLSTSEIMAMSPVDRQRYYQEVAMSSPIPAYDQPDIGPTRGGASQIAKGAGVAGSLYGANALTSGGAAASTAPAQPVILGASRAAAPAAGSSSAAGSIAAEGAGLGDYAAPVIGAGLTAYGASEMGKHWGKREPLNMAGAGATTGAGIGTMILPGIGTGIGAGIGAVVGGATGMIKSGRHKDHEARSNFRDELAQRGIALRTDRLGGTLPSTAVSNPTGTYVPLADGSFYDISPERGSRQAYEVLKPEGNWSGQAIGWADALATLATGARDEKITGDTAAQFTNALMSNAGDDVEMMRANALRLFQQYNINKEQAQAQIAELAKAGKIPADKAGAYMNSINTMFSGDGYTSNQQLADKGIVFGQKPAAAEQQAVTPARGGLQGPMTLPNKGNQGAQPQGALYNGPASTERMNPSLAANIIAQLNQRR